MSAEREATDDAVWHGCYDAGWQGEIVTEAFAHPAKISRALVRRIYEHAFAEGWLRPSEMVCDPFGGIGGTALDALWNGLAWVGVELEPRFVALGQQNLDLWQRKYGSKAGFGSAQIVQGDSRQLANVIRSGAWVKAASQTMSIGDSPGQLGAMKEGEPPRVDCVVSSPPYAESVNSKDHGIDWSKVGPSSAGRKRGPGTKHEETFRAQLAYGNSEGQLGALPEGRFDAVVSSPPYEGQQVGTGTDGRTGWRGYTDHGGGTTARGEQLSAMVPDTFWQAAREIVAQCHAILKPGGHAIWVCKDFVRKGKRVPFSDQWRALCESQGFRLVCRHRAMLVAYHGEQDDMLGEVKQLKTERKSFFRRLAEKKGSPAIDWEDVICLQAPLFTEVSG